MKNRFKSYVAFWAILFVLFNVIASLSPGWIGMEKYTASFWIGYIFIALMLIGQLGCASVIFKDNNAQKVFYGIPLIKASYTGLIVSFVVGGLCMIISPLPYWIGIIVCAIVLAANLMSILKASVAIDEVQHIDAKVKTKTFFIKSMTIDAETLMASAKSEKAKSECLKIYEAVRYSDPMSNDALASAENRITLKFAELTEAVKADDITKVQGLAKEVVVMIEDRNKKCKLLK